jgi:pimeloyl-ACP methyl ester carboxylesterase
MNQEPIVVREYGSAGPYVIVVHGGPGAPGHMAPVARELANEFRVLEPLQRESGRGPLTVASHLADLHDVVTSLNAAGVCLVGSSWGAMLALAYAASHPQDVQGVVAIGCGTFDAESRKRFKQIVDERTDPDLRARLSRLESSIPDANARLEAKAALLLPVYSYDVAAADLDLSSADARSNRETWSDMVRLQEEGVYPYALRSIEAPVLMLHGSVDPHPGRLIHRSLLPHVRRLEYHEWAECGHYPWLERSVREAFYERLKSWLRTRSSADVWSAGLSD